MIESEARELIAPYRSRLNEAIRSADSILNERFRTDRHWMKRRTLSSIRNDLVCSEMRRIFADDSNIRFESRAGRDLMYIRGEAIIVFKKVDGRRRRTHNWPTQLVMQLFGQGKLIDLPPSPRFVAGWQLDRLGIAVQDAILTYPKGQEAQFAIPLQDAAAQPSAMITPQAGTAPDSPSRVRVRKDSGRGDREQRANT